LRDLRAEEAQRMDGLGDGILNARV